MLEVKFHDNVSDELLKFAVIISKTNGKWVFCKHKERETYEVPVTLLNEVRVGHTNYMTLEMWKNRK